MFAALADPGSGAMVMSPARALAAGVAALGLAAAALAQAPAPLADFSHNPGNGTYRFASTTPALVLDVIQPKRPRPAATARGQLILPTDVPSGTTVPAVVLVHGSGGIYPEEVTYWARLLRIINGAAPPGLRFAAHVALYSGGCAGALSVTAKPGVFSAEPMLFVHGDADDYAYSSDCRSYAQRINAAGTPTEFVALPGARHKFDADSTRLVNARRNPKTKEGCPLEFDVVDMKMRDRRSGDIVPPDKVKPLSDELCAAKGATLQGDPAAREAAGRAVVTFLNRVFRT